MRPDNVYIDSIATFVPDRIKTARAVEWGWYDANERDRTGQLSVAVAGERPAPDMTIEAANEAIGKSDHDRDDIAMLLHSSVHYQGPDSWSVQHYILRHTVSRPIPALEIRQGCNGMVANLELAANLLVADGTRQAVLVTSGDNFSTPIVDRWRTTNLFVLADGAAGVVVSAKHGFARILAISSESDPELEPLHRGGQALFPPGITVGETLDMDARRDWWTEQWAQGNPPPDGDPGELVASAVSTVLDEASVTMADIERVVHMGLNRPTLQEAFYEPLGIDQAKGTWEITRRVGHAGPIDVFLGLEELWHAAHVVPGDKVLLVGAAPGMEANCAVVEIVSTPPDDAMVRFVDDRREANR